MSAYQGGGRAEGDFRRASASLFLIRGIICFRE